MISKEKKAVYDKKRRKDRGDDIREYDRRRYKLNKKPRQIASKKYYQANRAACIARTTIYNNKNSKAKNKYWAARKKNLWNSDANFRTKHLLRHRLWMAFQSFSKTGKTKTSDEYGINYNAICEWIGPKPDDGQDYHIDHIIPLCTFNFDDESQIKRAFAPTNHQWLTAEQNLSKGGKIVV